MAPVLADTVLNHMTSPVGVSSRHTSPQVPDHKSLNSGRRSALARLSESISDSWRTRKRSSCHSKVLPGSSRSFSGGLFQTVHKQWTCSTEARVPSHTSGQSLSGCHSLADLSQVRTSLHRDVTDQQVTALSRVCSGTAADCSDNSSTSTEATVGGCRQGTISLIIPKQDTLNDSKVKISYKRKNSITTEDVRLHCPCSCKKKLNRVLASWNRGLNRTFDSSRHKNSESFEASTLDQNITFDSSLANHCQSFESVKNTSSFIFPNGCVARRSQRPETVGACCEAWSRGLGGTDKPPAHPRTHGRPPKPDSQNNKRMRVTEAVKQEQKQAAGQCPLNRTFHTSSHGQDRLWLSDDTDPLDRLSVSYTCPAVSSFSLHWGDVSHTFKSLAVGEDGNTAAQKLMTACSVHNITKNVQNGAVSAGRVASWAVHFNKLLQDPQGISVFTEFLEKEFSDENIRFWKACQQFHELMSEQQRKVQAKEIYTQYLAPRASDPVNVDTTARSYTERFLDSPADNMFDVAQQQIFQLMKQDSYPRFLKSDLYKKMLTQELEHKSSSSPVTSGGQATVGKDQSSEKENVGKRRRSILPWKHYQKSGKGVSESDLKKLSKKGKVGVAASVSSNHLSVGVSNSGATPTSSLSSSSRHSSSQPTLGVSNQDFASASTTSLNNAGRNSQGALAKKSAGFGIDLSTMRKEVFQQKEVQGCPEPEVKFCRIIMPDGSTTVVCAKPGQTCRAVLSKLCEKRSLSISSVDVFLLGSDKILDLNEDISVLGSKEIVIEKRVVFRLDLPEGKCVGAKAKPNRTIRDVLKPILQKYGYAVDNICIQMTSSQQTIDLEMPVTKLDNQRITILSDRTGTAQKHASKGAMFGLFGTSEKRILEDRKQNQGKV